VTAALFLAQRLSAAVLAVAVTVHLATIIHAARAGMTAADVFSRTRGNVAFLILYGIFVLAVAVHAPIGLRNVLREWTPWRGRGLDTALAAFALLLLALGLRAALAVFLA
jgi:fumarate reductase subunit C